MVAEIFRDIGFERRLVAFEGQQEISLMDDNPVCNLDLSAHGVDGHEGTCKLAVAGKLVE